MSALFLISGVVISFFSFTLYNGEFRISLFKWIYKSVLINYTNQQEKRDLINTYYS